MKRSFITSLGDSVAPTLQTSCYPRTRFRERHTCLWAGMLQDWSCSAAASVTLRPRCPARCPASGPVGVDHLDPPGLRLKQSGAICHCKLKLGEEPTAKDDVHKPDGLVSPGTLLGRRSAFQSGKCRISPLIHSSLFTVWEAAHY